MDSRATREAHAPESGTVRPGDRLVVHTRNEGHHPRDGEILEVRGPDGQPPYLVRWSDDGHESLVFPGPGATIAGPPA